MALATLTARVDEKDKASFDNFCSNVGLNTSTAIKLYICPFAKKYDDHCNIPALIFLLYKNKVTRIIVMNTIQ